LVSRSKKLRSGYTTGACAAAAAKAATILLFSTEKAKEVEIPFPDGSRHKFRIQDSGFRIQGKMAWASVIKDAGDDPDVTNRAEIMAEVRIQDSGYRIQDEKNHASCIVNRESSSLLIKGGKGVGVITKPGLPVPAGEPAINPVPRQMIKEAVMEAIQNTEYRIQPPTLLSPLRGEGKGGGESPGSVLEITISVPDGENLAKKTLNSRLGIIGGISILGTTGIVKPVSSEAWTATIASSMDVAKAMRHDEVVLSAGRLSEKAHMKKNNLPEDAYVMMGDYLEFALLEAKKHGFKKIHLCAQWAKMLKIAMATPQTHVKHGALDTKKAVEFLNHLGIKISQDLEFNTAHEIFDFITSTFNNPQSIFPQVCSAAKKYVEGITSGIPVIIHLISYGGEIIASSE
jgi:cobalt-precorrin-5B (C1)-methyltransferase